jgi:predicted aldo/keto reductase-like oxidoreductase
MRLPVIDRRMECIDVPLAAEMLEYAIDNGVNYVDTAFPYHSATFGDQPGESEGFVGQVLAGGYRDKVLVATKLPVWLAKSRKDMERLLAGQLERLRTDHIDCYLLHSLNKEEFERAAKAGVLEFLDAAKTAGHIRFAGFSYHDAEPNFAPIVDAYDWDFCQIQYNYMDMHFQAGVNGLAYAAAKGLGVVVMEPLKGGRLAGKVPQSIQAVWDAAAVRRTPTEWALRFVWDDPRVSLLLSGMSAMEHVIENVKAASEALPASLTPADLDLFERVREAYKARTVVDCTECRYCMPCPQGINIPLVFSCRNDAALFDDLEGARRGYGMEVGLNHTAPATACVECGQCEEACPQKIEIIKELAAAVEVLGRPEPGPPPAL